MVENFERDFIQLKNSFCTICNHEKIANTFLLTCDFPKARWLSELKSSTASEVSFYFWIKQTQTTTQQFVSVVIHVVNQPQR